MLFTSARPTSYDRYGSMSSSLIKSETHVQLKKLIDALVHPDMQIVQPMYSVLPRNKQVCTILDY